MDLDTMTNNILNNEYKLKENENIEVEEKPKKRGYGLDKYYEEEMVENTNKKIKNHKPKHSKAKKRKKKKTIRQKIFLIIKILVILLILAIAFIYIFFKTNIFQKYKELWVQTAMTTMNHQYLATWFLSDEEIAQIMKSLEVVNDENSNSENIIVQQKKQEITVEKISGKGYVGYVMIVPDATKVKLVDGRLSR